MVTWITTDRLGMRRTLYIGVLAAVTAALGAGYVFWLGVDVVDLLTGHGTGLHPGGDDQAVSRTSRAGRWARAAAPLGPLTLMSAVPAAFFALFVAPRIRTCGATTDELSRAWPGDELVPHPGFVWTNAVTIHRPAADVWPWVTQLGQGRGGLYSYDWLENALLADVHSVSELVPALQQPMQVGDRVIRMTRYAPYNPVARYDPGRALVLGGVADTPRQLRAGRPSSTWAFIVEPVDSRRCRLVVRSRSGGPAARLQGPVRFVMQRRMMLGIKQRAEGMSSASAADVLIPLSWFTAAVAAAVHGGRALPGGRARPPALAMGSLAGVGVQVLLFWDVPAWLRAVLTTALVGSPLLPFGEQE